MMYSVKPLFELGDIHISEGVTRLFEEDLGRLIEFLEFHQMGHWGDIPNSDKKLNEHHLRIKRPVLSLYWAHGNKVFVITDLKANTTWVTLKIDIKKGGNNDGSQRFKPRVAV